MELSISASLLHRLDGNDVLHECECVRLWLYPLLEVRHVGERLRVPPPDDAPRQARADSWHGLEVPLVRRVQIDARCARGPIRHAAGMAREIRRLQEEPAFEVSAL